MREGLETCAWVNHQAPYLLVEFPREANVIEALQVWHRLGTVHRCEIVTSWYGDPMTGALGAQHFCQGHGQTAFQMLKNTHNTTALECARALCKEQEWHPFMYPPEGEGPQPP